MAGVGNKGYLGAIALCLYVAVLSTQASDEALSTCREVQVQFTTDGIGSASLVPDYPIHGKEDAVEEN